MTTTITHITIHNSDGTQQRFVPDAITPPPPKPPAKRKRVGVNIAEWQSWATDAAFFNEIHRARPCFGSSMNGFNDVPLALRPDGLPESIPDGVTASVFLDFVPAMPNATYIVTWSGPHDAVAIGHQQGRDNVLKWSRTQHGVHEHCNITFRKPISDLVMVRVGVTGDYVFANDYVASLTQFCCLRFLGPHLTNYVPPNKVGLFGDRREYSWTNAPLTVMVDLCRQTKSDMWLPSHHFATDAQVRSVAKALQDFEHTVYIQHSNETWNTGFPQHTYSHTEGSRTGGNYWTYEIQRSAELGRIFASEGVRHKCVVGWQSVQPKAFEWYVGQLPKGKLPKEIHAVAIAPYFGYSGDYPAEARKSVKALLDYCEKTLEFVAAGLKQWAALCNLLGVELTAYEGGQHLVTYDGDTNLQQLIIEANRDKRMGELHQQYLDLWEEINPGGLMMLHTHCSASGPHGAWGLKEHYADNDAPKCKAVLDWITKGE